MAIQATRRMVTEGGLEVRSDSQTVTVEGYASTFNEKYDMGWYTESVAPGAFTRTLGTKPDVSFLINHDGLPLARTTSDTLDLAQDSTGLHTRAVLDAHDPDVMRIVPKMKRGDLDKMSFAFGIPKGGDSWSSDMSERTLTELSLAGGDVSIVTNPANPGTSIGLRMRQIAKDDPSKLRDLYADITNGRTELPEATSVRMAAMLEGLFAGVESTDLVDLSDLLGKREEETPLEETTVVTPDDIRSLIAAQKAHAKR